MAHADVLVVGGGLWGLNIAWHLANGHGMSVTILERAPSPGLETSGQAAGQLGQLREQALACDAARYALDFAASLADRRDPQSFVRSGSVTLVETEAAATMLHERCAKARAAGVAVDAVSRAEVARLIPGLTGEYAAHYGVSTDGYIDPRRHLAALADDLRTAGVGFVGDCEVLGVDIDGSKVVGLRTGSGVVAAGVVVVAAGPWTPLLLPAAVPEIAVQPIPLRQARTAACGVAPTHPVVRFPELSAYVRPERGGYLFGAFERPGVDLPSRLPSHSRTLHLSRDDARLLATRARLAARLPALGTPPVEHFRQGWTTFTPDGLPLAGRHPALPNLWIASGCGAMGCVWAPSLGRWLAHSIHEGAPIPMLAMLDPWRFGDRARDRAWVQGESIRRHVDYYGTAKMPANSDTDRPTPEQFSWTSH